ncbi:TPA: hypothetical protein ACPFQA_002530 [Citrobacter braakii]|nr:hypothetical protein [Salmonella enterica]EKE1131719.1 hypothetical protein [Salmonella enterica]
MAKVIFTVTTKDVFTDEGQAKELIDVNAVIEGVNPESPSAADHLANIINKMAPQIIKAAHFHYVSEWNARSENKRFNH